MDFPKLGVWTIFPVLATIATSSFELLNNNEERIIAGKPAVDAQFPWHVILRRTFYGPPMCGGSLISNQWVLTAAHCIEGREETYLSMGDLMWDSHTMVSKTVLSRFLYIHAAYEQQHLYNDIGLIKMPIPIHLNKFIQTISLPKPPTDYVDLMGMNATALGFGLIDDSEARRIPPKLMFVEAGIISNDKCSAAYGREIPQNSLCFLGSTKQSTCKGDSGGSLVIKNKRGEYVIIGVTSFGAKKCELPWPSVFARVTTFLEWIQSALSDS